MKRVFPEPLKPGDEIRMVAPSSSFRIISAPCREVANRRLEKELGRIPVLAETDFGHTDPKFTFPIGGTARMKAAREGSSLEILER